MAFIRKILFAGSIIAIVFFISLFVLIRFQGKAFILKKAEAVFNRPLAFDDIQYVFPLGIRLSNLNIDGLLFAGRVELLCTPGLLGTTELSIDEVTLEEAVLTLHRDKDNHILWQGDADVLKKSGQNAVSAPARPVERSRAIIRNLRVNNGRIISPGHEQEDAVGVYLTDVAIDAKNVPLSGQEMDTVFKLSGKVLDNRSAATGNDFKGEGWVNWPKRNMQADVSVSRWRDQFDVDLKAVSVNNDMKVSGHMISRKDPEVAAAPEGQPADLLSGLIKNSSLAMDMTFAFTMKMDRWELRNIDFSGNLSASKKDLSAPVADEAKQSGQ